MHKAVLFFTWDAEGIPRLKTGLDSFFLLVVTNVTRLQRILTIFFICRVNPRPSAVSRSPENSGQKESGVISTDFSRLK